MPGPDPLTQRVVAPVPQDRNPRGLLDAIGEGEREPMSDHDAPDRLDGIFPRLESLLRTRKLPYDARAVARLKEDLEIALDAVEESAAWAMLKDDAVALAAAIDEVFKQAANYDLEHSGELQGLRRLRTFVATRLSMKGKPLGRAWLWPCCLNFLETWTMLTQRPAGVYHDIEESPALLFLVDCCKLIDPTVNASAIRYAQRVFSGSTRDGDEAPPAE